MDTRSLMDQLLKSGTEFLQSKSTEGAGKSTGGANLKDLLSGTSGGVLAGGALGLLLGSKKGRKVGGKVLTYGSLAALGAVAFKAYNSWQEQNAQTATTQPQTLNVLPDLEAETHSRAMLRAMIGAAKADGHIDENERRMIDEGLGHLVSDSSLKAWLDEELNKPLDPADIAASATTPEMAAEIYLVSLMVVDEESFMEKAYLEELARQLKLDPALKAELEASRAQ